MRNIERRAAACTLAPASALGRAAALAVALVAGSAWAEPAAQGFAVERLALAAPGSAFLALDDLAFPAALGGGVSLSLGYAHAPLRIPAAAGSLTVVEHQAFAAAAFALTYDRFRAHAELSSPIYVAGHSGVAGGFEYTAPVANLEQSPDVITDVRVGLEARLLGDAQSPLRAGLGAELVFPSGDRAAYATDDTYRAFARLLLAGESGRFSFAANAGVHVRPLDDAPTPGSPRGSELVFGGGAAARLAVAGQTLHIGPEVLGATALRAFFAGQQTALEALLSASLRGPALASGRVQLKLSLGAGLQRELGAPQWRAVAGVDLSGLAQGPR